MFWNIRSISLIILCDVPLIFFALSFRVLRAQFDTHYFIFCINAKIQLYLPITQDVDSHLFVSLSDNFLLGSSTSFIKKGQALPMRSLRPQKKEKSAKVASKHMTNIVHNFHNQLRPEAKILIWPTSVMWLATCPDRWPNMRWIWTITHRRYNRANIYSREKFVFSVAACGEIVMSAEKRVTLSEFSVCFDLPVGILANHFPFVITSWFH